MFESGEPLRPRWLAFVFAAPLVVVMVIALVKDPGRVGTRSSASGALPEMLVLLWIATVLFVLTWCFSAFRFRAVVVVLQLLVLWSGGLLYAFEVRVDVTWWDVAESALFLATTLLQLVRGPGATREPRGEASSLTGPLASAHER